MAHFSISCDNTYRQPRKNEKMLRKKKKQVKINLNSAIILSHFIKKGAHKLFKCNLIQSFIISCERLLNLN